MKAITNPTANDSGESRPPKDKLEKRVKHRKSFISRRSFLGKSLVMGAGTIGVGLLGGTREARASGGLTPGDAALLRFPAALELLEADFWIQYNELGGIQDDEVPGGSGNPDLIRHRLTNLTQLTIDTSWWTRYRDDSHNPDLDPDHVFPQAVPTLGVNQHTAIPRTDADTTDPNFLQAIANTAAFHFPTIEQGGNSLYPSLAQRATHEEVIRILVSIGPTETMHFQTWSDVAGNAPPLTAVDPVTGVSVTFPDLEVEDELFDKALIMPEPCPFLDRSLPIVSIIRPTKTQGVAMGTLQFLTDMGLFIGQSPAFFAYMTQLARDADRARHGRR
jgi:hypothetical protein